ncbi:MAG: dipeptidase [Firmicutes bacterium]|nr:dipeptidase [Bacillota bacterium]
MIDVDRHFAERRERHLAELMDFLRIPSISALSAHREDVRRAAAWLAERLRRAGLEHVEVEETGGHPVVTADWLHAPGAPTVLIYGHYDVQPVDPESLWTTPPFEPQIRDGRLYARGASDDKGQTFMHVLAVEAWLQETGRLPVNVKFLVEGEEEVGSRNLDAFVARHRERLAADVVVVSDTPMLAPGRPAVCYGLRGIASMEVRVQGPASDLHSGLFGGSVLNPIQALVGLLASLHAPDGRVAVPGFYDDVRPLTPEEREAFARLPFDEEEYRRRLGVPELFGEPGYTTLERVWARPTLEFNGISGGFQGEGGKTIVPSWASAKISCRLVPDQDPQRILDALERHLRERAPRAVQFTVERGQGSPASVVPLDHPAVRAAARVLEETYGRPADFIRMGGSIPVVPTFRERLGAPVVLLGFGLPDENFHAPNEFFTLENFDLGVRALARYWAALAQSMAGRSD